MTIGGSINVTNIDKDKLFVGKKGKYLEIVLLETPNDKYGNNFMIVQGATKEERLAGIKGRILGNAKFIGKDALKSDEPRESPAPARTHELADAPADDLPF